MTQGPQPIETRYKGYRFRSRLEARWALVYDTLGVPWQYEPQGFELSRNVFYLPDFWLPDQRCYVEIKATRPTEEEQLKARLLAERTGHPVIIHFGQVPYPNPSDIDSDGDSGHRFDPFGNVRDFFWWSECPQCDALGIQYRGQTALLCSCAPSGPRENYDSPRLIAAYRAGREARFEHGQRGTPENIPPGSFKGWPPCHKCGGKVVTSEGLLGIDAGRALEQLVEIGWWWGHTGCAPEELTYTIAAINIRTVGLALQWTVHLAEKSWFKPRVWSAMLNELFDLPSF